MKTLIGAFALIIAAPVAAQTAAPATDPHAGHAQPQQGKHDCKECCEKMKGKDGKMECMEEKADAKSATPNASSQAHEDQPH